MKKIVVTGISGFLGLHFSSAPRSAWEIHGIYYQNGNHLTSTQYTWEADLNDLEYTKVIFDQIEPEAIIHLAAVSKPADCLQDTDYSYRLNVIIPAFLAQYAYAKRIPFYFASTDLVFDGTKGFYSYLDRPNPVNLYGKQKYEAERRILDIHPAAAVLRLPLLYGHTPKRNNFITDWMDQLNAGQEVMAFTDEYRTPLYVRDAVRGILKLLRKRKSGIWHLAGPERLSRHEMALQVADLLGANLALVVGKKQAEVSLHVPRPADVSLICEKANAENFYARKFSEGLKSTFRRYQKGRSQDELLD
jgi:dTDP-4-dehydrorhamnose reductase